MPLGNSADKEWTGWLVDNLGSREQEFQQALMTALEARKIPKSKITAGTVNMWWRKDSRCIDVVSDLDGNIMATIHIQEYGSGLMIGRAVDPPAQWNYYKRMAAGAFTETIDRCIRETILSMAAEEEVRTVTDSRRVMK
ncbi:MAG: hypothetical protein BroJett011_62370 [Chloroflexota bacterium]|nr:MAG: hypothetical protein BroJett011_62370 [Chloroflexota bacterium]